MGRRMEVSHVGFMHACSGCGHDGKFSSSSANFSMSLFLSNGNRIQAEFSVHSTKKNNTNFTKLVRAMV